MNCQDAVKSPELLEKFQTLGLRTYTRSPQETRAQIDELTKRIERLLARGVKLR